MNPSRGNPQASEASLLKAARATRWPIYNRRLLGSLVKNAVRDRFGSQREAARQTGINQTLLSRLIKETQSEIDVGNFMDLHSLIPEELHGSLSLAIVPRGARLLGRRYSSWLGRSLDIASAGVGDWLIRTGDGYKTRHYRLEEGRETVRDYERRVLWRYVRRRSPHLVRSAEKVFGKHGDSRLSLTRVLDPLINSPESGFIEPSWRELRCENYKRIEKIIDLGVKRENLLLSRRITPVRMIEVFTLSPVEFRKRFGKEAIAPSVIRRARKQSVGHQLIPSGN